MCSVCGTRNRWAKTGAQPPTMYGHFPTSSQGEPSSHARDVYPPQTDAPPQHTRYIVNSRADTFSYRAVPPYQMGTPGYTPIGRFALPNKNVNGLAVEIVLSLIGIFGLGWLMAGEIAIGVILLICSVIIYWPLMIIGTAFTEGLGLICLGPLAIASIILNAVLLNSVMRRKATHFMMMRPPQPPRMPIPPQPQ